MAGESMDKPYKLRFRHLNGDVGPLTFQESSTVLAMKNQIWEDWPTEEPLSSLKPESIQYLRIMYQGKILQDMQTISDLKQLPGEIVPDRCYSVHMVNVAQNQHQRRTASDVVVSIILDHVSYCVGKAGPSWATSQLRLVSAREDEECRYDCAMSPRESNGPQGTLL